MAETVVVVATPGMMFWLGLTLGLGAACGVGFFMAIIYLANSA